MPDKMKIHRFPIIAILALFLSGTSCSPQIDDPKFDYNLKSAKLIETNNDFGLELLRSVFEAEDTPNVMISPASVSIALGMAYNGAETTTRDAFEEVLNYEGLTREEVNEITRELIHVLVTNLKGNLLEIANSLWYNEGFPVEEDFISLNSHYYDAEVRELDFGSAEAVKTINNWVSDQTHGKIDEIIDAIDPAVMMILINAIYFNCVWETEFNPEDTYRAPFYHEDGTSFGEVDLMHLKSTLNASFTEDFSAVELPYKNGKFSMFLFLPEEEKGVNDLVAELNGDAWNSWLAGFSEVEKFTVEMPKFEFEYERSLAEDLKSMGLEVAFSDTEADFSGITPEDLFISDVIHKTYIKVNEEGTEAAAVTAIIMETTSAGPRNYLRLDRPFLFAITENSSKSILFMGKVAEPSYN
ncbi:MAG: serpin family protein [Bacteroidia bacterium]|nr:MAG: serpin family protein [Bacteroidia bacterium]